MLLDYIMHIPPERKKKVSSALFFIWRPDWIASSTETFDFLLCNVVSFLLKAKHPQLKENDGLLKLHWGWPSYYESTFCDSQNMQNWTGHHNWDLTKETQECYSFLLFRCLMKFPLLNTSVSVFNFFQISPVASPFFKNNSKGPSDNLNIFLFLFLFCSNSVFMYSYPALSST